MLKKKPGSDFCGNHGTGKEQEELGEVEEKSLGMEGQEQEVEKVAEEEAEEILGGLVPVEVEPEPYCKVALALDFDMFYLPRKVAQLGALSTHWECYQ